MRKLALVFVAILFCGIGVFATIFGTVRGIVHDAQHRPIAGTDVVLKAKASDYTQKTATDAEGQFHFDAVPLGEYVVRVSGTGFAEQETAVTVLSGAAPILHVELRVASQNESVTVAADVAPGQAESVTP